MLSEYNIFRSFTGVVVYIKFLPQICQNTVFILEHLRQFALIFEIFTPQFEVVSLPLAQRFHA